MWGVFPRFLKQRNRERYLKNPFPQLITVFPQLITVFPQLITVFPQLITVFPQLITVFPQLITVFPQLITVFPQLITVFPQLITTQKQRTAEAWRPVPGSPDQLDRLLNADARQRTRRTQPRRQEVAL
ncbi:unnamed protein product [Arctogadus glacialis]